MSTLITNTPQRVVNFLRGVFGIVDEDRVMLEGSKAISYADLVTALNSDLTVTGSGKTMREILKQQILTDK